MAMSNKELAIVLKMKDQASKKLEGVSGKLKKFKGVAIGAAVAGVAVLGAALIKCTKDAADQEMIFAKLEQAVENTGVPYDSVKGKIDEFTASMQKMTVYGDTETAKLLQDLVPYTNDVEKAMEGSKIAMDMASAGLFDLSTASKYVGMAMGGNVEMLGRYVPELRASSNEQLKNMTAAEKTAYALDILKQKYGGMAEKELNTFHGKMKQLGNYMGDFREGIGDGLIPVITNLAKHFAGKGESMAETGKRWGEKIAGFINGVIMAIHSFKAGIEKMTLGFYKNIALVQERFAEFKERFLGIIVVILENVNLFIERMSKIPIIGNQFGPMADVIGEALERVKEAQNLAGDRAEIYEEQMNNLDSAIAEVNQDLGEKYNALYNDIEATDENTAATNINTDATKNNTGAIDNNTGATKENLKAQLKLAKEKKTLLEKLNDTIYELTHTETEIRKRELDKQVEAWKKIYGKDGDMLKKIQEYYDLAIKEIEEGEEKITKKKEKITKSSKKKNDGGDDEDDDDTKTYTPGGSTIRYISKKKGKKKKGGGGSTYAVPVFNPETGEMWTDKEARRYYKNQKNGGGQAPSQRRSHFPIWPGSIGRGKQESSTTININMPNAVMADRRGIQEAVRRIGPEIRRQVDRGYARIWMK